MSRLRGGERRGGVRSLADWLREVLPRCCCSCCEKERNDADRPTVNQATATAERVARPHRPHAPGNRKSTPEMLSAVRCALSQLQGDSAPPLTQVQAEAPASRQELDDEVCNINKTKSKRVNYFTIR